MAAKRPPPAKPCPCAFMGPEDLQPTHHGEWCAKGRCLPPPQPQLSAFLACVGWQLQQTPVTSARCPATALRFCAKACSGRHACLPPALLLQVQALLEEKSSLHALMRAMSDELARRDEQLEFLLQPHETCEGAHGRGYLNLVHGCSFF